MKDSFAEKAIEFFTKLHINTSFPKGVELMNPYKDEQVVSVVREFFSKYYDDKNKRTGIFGINPGRFGAGITGIAFTDPVNLQQKCDIENKMQQKHELSSLFIYEMIEAYGGVEQFNDQFFLTAVCPLGFVKDGKNLNYYDQNDLLSAVENFIVKNIRDQIDLGLKTGKCLCLGEGKNYKYFSKLNEEHGFFGEIIPLAHPRYIMQYKRKSKEKYIGAYLNHLKI